MFVVLWEFEVKPGCQEQFEKVYSPGGDWDSLFRRDANHAATYLFRDTLRPRTYLTTDYWLSRRAYEEFCEARQNDYQALDAATGHLTTSEKHIGSFETQAATSGPRP